LSHPFPGFPVVHRDKGLKDGGDDHLKPHVGLNSRFTSTNVKVRIIRNPNKVPIVISNIMVTKAGNFGAITHGHFSLELFDAEVAAIRHLFLNFI
jgi:hypothetical protein